MYEVDRREFPPVLLMCGWSRFRAAWTLEIHWGRKTFADVGESAYRHCFVLTFGRKRA